MEARDLPATYDRLRQILEPHLRATTVVTDEPGSLYLQTGPAGKPEMFAAVSVKTSSVAFHYMPVYRHPDLLDGIPPDLRKRLKGKSCFHFRRADDPAIDDLRRLVDETATAALTGDQ